MEYFHGKVASMSGAPFFLPPNPMILLVMILPQSICLTQAINETCDEEKGRHRAVGTHRQGPAGVHPETRLGQRFAPCVARVDGAALALWALSDTNSERDASCVRHAISF